MIPSRHSSWISALAITILPMAPGARASGFATVWQLGADDQSLSPFSQESFGPNSAPGSATIKDDDYYLSGTYPAPIGTLATDEPIANFERAVTSGDPRNRIHFPLTAAQASAGSLLRVTIDLSGGGAWINGSIPGFSTHDITVRLNGQVIGTRNGIAWNHTIVLTLPATTSSAVAGANVLQIERTGGGAGGYIGFDYLKLEADTVALLDADGDGMPRWFEDTYGFSDESQTDVAGDPDDDGLSNLEEFQKGTNPTDSDSDNDGLADGAELVTNPAMHDTDGDGLSDGEETTTSPMLADSDGDGIPDPVEIGQGSDPANHSSVPFDYPGAIGLQFLSEQQADAKLGDWELAGRFRFHHWNASAPLPHWISGGTVLNGSISNLRNHRGQSTSAAATWSYHHAGDGLHKGTGDERLLNGMIRTQRNASINTPATVNLTGIPYATYDLIVYPGYIYPNSRGVVRLDGNPATNRYFVSETSPPFIRWREATATTLAGIKPGNHVRYRNLTGANRSVALESVDFETVGIHAIQIVESGTDTDGDGIKDITELEYAFNPAVADAAADKDGDGMTNLGELTAGTDPNDPDSDNDGIPDGAESAFATSPLDPDSDNDGLLDGTEVNGSLFPSSPVLTDTDSDGFSDPTELAHASDPSSATSVPPPVPVWDAPARTWRWRIDNLRVLWNHHQSMLGAIQYDDSMLCEAVADIEQSGWSRQIAIGIRYVGGRLTYRFRGIEGAFHQNGNPTSGFWDSDWNSSPTDRLRDFGFSGYGTADDSKPLRFEFAATQPVSGTNLWTISFLIADLTNPATPVTLATWSRTNAVAAHASLLSGTTIWRNTKGQAGHIDLNTETGARALISSAAPGTPDADSDGMPNSWETTHLFNPNNAADAPTDTDADGLSNVRECHAGTNPRDPDSDDDGAPDGAEIHHGSNPMSNSSLPAWFNFAGNIDDLDGDGLSDAWVLWSGGKHRASSADDDGDGVSNLDESRAGTDPDDASSRFDLVSWRDDDDLVLAWTDLPDKQTRIESGTSLTLWQPLAGLPPATTAGGRKRVSIPAVFPSSDPGRFYRAGISRIDSDGDGIEDWTENAVLGSDADLTGSMGQSLVRSNGQTLTGDALALLNRVQGGAPNGGPAGSTAPGTPSPVQASRFLMQATFGPTTESIKEVLDLGYEAWIDQQLALPSSFLRPYIRQIKSDGAGPRIDPTYNFNTLDNFVHGNNVTTPFARIAVGAPDQLRQRMAFALSQILVVSRRDAQLEEKPEGMTHYYDTLVRHALGNYGDLLREVTFHPAMGWYLSSAGNQKADPSIPRYPDENYAREIMQLFTIGLWELNPDGIRKLDLAGEPIPTYDNGDITELARVFTGMYFASPYGWGGGGWADDHYTLPMVMYPDRHDFGVKRLPNNFVIPAREASETNAVQDIRDAVDALFRHPNTPPFICRQLIQFLVTDNPSPAYVKRVQDVFVNDGSGTRGNLGAVAKAILMDPEARALPLAPGSGKVREPVIRTMHLGRLLKLPQTHPDFVWWNWTENFYDATLQEPMNSPSVFNFYTPVYQAPGEIRTEGLVSPGFQIINTYTAVSFPNLLWDYLHDGFKSAWSWEFPLDYSEPLLLADNPAALLDRIDLLVCAGNLTARTRSILMDKLTDSALSRKERVALALWIAMNSPEGVVQR
jgi:uncharacterized protein (DUF1800 family)